MATHSSERLLRALVREALESRIDDHGNLIIPIDELTVLRVKHAPAGWFATLLSNDSMEKLHFRDVLPSGNRDWEMLVATSSWHRSWGAMVKNLRAAINFRLGLLKSGGPRDRLAVRPAIEFYRLLVGRLDALAKEPAPPELAAVLAFGEG